ncbi:nitroreductase family protein [Clostridium estertheticum]|uniref:nitroreductase family protein n=1 Tax=Clostridium estertheticum TaxID=238834 RepID=UPI001C0DE32E|nr:nitroreductase family protein [Clostridium estertheticum]MBU3071878.1 nitroreductase [Clostridium estertheticum]MBU3161970.1 nitroreductase [Clostridium estertheticum]
MNVDFSIEDVVKKRYSVRNYKGREIEPTKRKAIESFIDSLDNPFGNKVNFHYLDDKDIKNKEKLGTYGVIKGSKQYIGTTIKSEPMALEALGYELEAVVLYLEHLGLGTCWLGGTFDREGFADAMKIKEGELFPIITPYGYAAATKHEKEIEMRIMIQADKRKDWNQLFYKNDFKSPLTSEDAGSLAFPLEMVRLAPSASNKQPWRILLKDGDFHFYEYKEPGYSDRFPYDIQSVDMGIAAAHFDFSLKEKGIKGHFNTTSKPELKLSENMEYAFSWIRE